MAATPPGSEALLTTISATNAEPELRLAIPRYFNQGNDLVFSVGHPLSNGTYELQFTTNLTPPIAWKVLERGLPGQTNFVISNPRTVQGFFRLRVPHLTAPRAVTVPEDMSLLLRGIHVSGLADAAAGLHLEVTNGFLDVISTNGVFVSRDHRNTVLTLSGPQEALNSALLNLRYQGDTNYYGPDGLSVTLTNTGPAGTIRESVRVAITVTPVNDPPEAVPDAYSISEDTALFVPAPGVLGNDHDVERDPLRATLFTGPRHGNLTLNADGSFFYQPEPSFNGADSFSYRPNDGVAEGNVATVAITVLPAHDSPQLRLTSPTNGAAVAVGTEISLTIAALESDGAIVQVEYLSDAKLLGTVASAPFTFIWHGATVGNHILTARATDDSGAVGTSQPVTITVGSDCDGDGVSDALEVLNGTDPCDFFNGIAPVLTPLGGNYQSGPAGSVLPQPMILRVANSAGVLPSNAPVTFTVTESAGLVSGSTNGPWTVSVTLSTGDAGTAAAYLRLPPDSAQLCLISASAGPASNFAQVTFAQTTSGPSDGWVLEDKPVAVATGGEHTLALLADGTVRAWGRNTEGQLGNGITVPYSSTPLQIAGLSNVSALAAGAWHSMALKANGTVAVWGQYLEGSRAAPPAGLADVAAIAAGTGHSLALLSNGTVHAWGDRFTSYSPPPTLSDVTAVAAGHGFSLALRADGTVVAWGISPYDNNFGQTNLPPGLTGIRAIAAGGFHGLALRSDGMVVAWGLNNFGQTDVPTSAAGAVAIAAGAYHSLALKPDGAVIAWGNLDPALFDPLARLRDILALAAGGVGGASHSAALDSDGTIWTWGANGSGQLGDGSQTARAAPVRVLGLPLSTTTNEVSFQVYTPLK